MKIVPSETLFFSISPSGNKVLELVKMFLFQKCPVTTWCIWRMTLSINSTKLFSSCGIWVWSPFHPLLKLLCFNCSSSLEGKEVLLILHCCSSVWWNYVNSAVLFWLGCNTTSENRGLLWNNAAKSLLPHFKKDKLHLQCPCQTERELHCLSGEKETEQNQQDFS